MDNVRIVMDNVHVLIRECRIRQIKIKLSSGVGARENCHENVNHFLLVLGTPHN